METVSATVKHINDQYFIDIDVGTENAKIPMSEDNPNEVKSAFNILICRLKGGKFRIELTDVNEDLFAQVAKEYIAQLNREIQEVYGEMQNYGLVNA